MERFSGLVENVGRFLDNIAAFCVAATMAVVVLNIILRTLFNRPLLGTVEYVNILTAVTIGLALAYCAFCDGQIAVDFLMEKLPLRLQATSEIITGILAFGFWALVARYMLDYSYEMLTTGLVSSTVQIPMYPVSYLIALGLLALCLVILYRITESVRKVWELA
ncbi:MAG: TRAP transporter small permease [Syntrophomonadaceae bacterium]|jgi:TRAP-type C4-dicarboxylate transport system permease small subunit|nr:TRAP transporter small permease [Syntrophomonadaceae bacterium]